MQILILRGGALGDFLITLPALQALRERYPAASITVVGNRRAAQLAVEAELIAAALEQHEARWAHLFADSPLPDTLNEWLRAFTLVVSYWPDPEGTLARHFGAWGDQFVRGSATVNAAPAARHFLLPLERLGCHAGADLAPILRFRAERTEEAAARLGAKWNGVALHPGSGSRAKTWPLERWHELARRLQRPVLWITGEADRACPPPPDLPVITAENWPLPLLGAALSRCTYYVGHDTGISHLAAASGAVGTLLFGPTDPRVWAPPTPRLRVIRPADHRLESITVEQVLAAV